MGGPLREYSIMIWPRRFDRKLSARRTPQLKDDAHPMAVRVQPKIVPSITPTAWKANDVKKTIARDGAGRVKQISYSMEGERRRKHNLGRTSKIKRKCPMPWRGAGGMSLVELMVAVAVTAVVMASVYAGFSAHYRLYGQEQQILELQQSVRVALDMAAQILQQAGYWRCVNAQALSSGSPVVKNTLKEHGGLFHTHPVMGWNNVTESFDPFADKQALQGTDVLGYSFMDPAFEGSLSRDQDRPHDPLHLIKNRDTSALKKGHVVFMTDCRWSALFQVTSVNTAENEVVVDHAANILIPGNVTRCLRCDDGGSACLEEWACAAPGTGFRKETTSLHRVRVGFFRVNRKGEFQWIEGGPDGAGRFVFSGPRTLAENVEDFQVEFGVDTDPVPDGVVDDWVSADAVPRAESESGVVHWERVRAVRSHLLGRTKRRFKGHVDTNLDVFADRKAEPAADGYRRWHMVKTVRIRNAVP